MAVSGPSARSDEMDVEGGGGIFADINITPLTDIFLVLLIIFMVTTTALSDTSGGASGGLKVTLPKGGKAQAVQEAHDLAVAVLQDGRIVVGGKVYDEGALAALFDKSHDANPNTLVLLQADEGVGYGKAVAVMDLARKHGLANLAIATRADAE